jgi:hypothetical protein
LSLVTMTVVGEAAPRRAHDRSACPVAVAAAAEDADEPLALRTSGRSASSAFSSASGVCA